MNADMIAQHLTTTRDTVATSVPAAEEVNVEFEGVDWRGVYNAASMARNSAEAEKAKAAAGRTAANDKLRQAQATASQEEQKAYSMAQETYVKELASALGWPRRSRRWRRRRTTLGWRRGSGRRRRWRPPRTPRPASWPRLRRSARASYTPGIRPRTLRRRPSRQQRPTWLTPSRRPRSRRLPPKPLRRRVRGRPSPRSRRRRRCSRCSSRPRRRRSPTPSRRRSCGV